MTTDIRDLTARYFEGVTSTEEDKQLRRYFAERPVDELPEELKALAPLFRFMDDESTAMTALNEIKKEEIVLPRRKSLKVSKSRIFTATAAAAAVLLIALILVTGPDKDHPTVNGNYAWVNGKKITDPVTVQKYAEISFGNVRSDRNMVEEQLNFVLE